jgi:hypothetical protein
MGTRHLFPDGADNQAGAFFRDELLTLRLLLDWAYQGPGGVRGAKHSGAARRRGVVWR